MNLDQIRYFLEVSKYLNFTEAAKNLYITQPTLSNKISALEKELDIDLFIRTKRSVKLTPAGNVLYKEFSTIHEQIYTSITKAKLANEGTTGTIKIGCLEAIDTSLFLPTIVNSFLSKYPTVNLVFERHSFKTLRDKFTSGDLDVIFTFSFETHEMNDVNTDVIYVSEAAFAIPSSNPLSKKSSLSFEDLDNEILTLISPIESPNGTSSLLSLCKKYSYIPKNINYCQGLESLLLYLESGLGIAILDTSLKLPPKSTIKLFTIPISDRPLDIVLAWKNNNTSSTINLFVEQVLDMPAKYFNLKPILA